MKSLGRLVEFAANVLIFAEQPQPKRFPLSHVCTAQHRLIDTLKAVVESIFECPSAGIDLDARRR